MKKYRTFIIILILGTLGLLYYFYLSTNDRTTSGKKSANKTDTDKVLERNLEDNYPATPREVVDYYSSIIACCYEYKHDDEEIRKLAMQSLKLFDNELAEKNPIDEFSESLKSDIEQYQIEKKKISTYVIERSSDIEYKTFQSHYYAMVDCVYYVKGDGSTSRTLETYTLRKDSTGKWKILYWTLSPTENEE